MQLSLGQITKQSQTTDRSIFLDAMGLVLAIKLAGSRSDARGAGMAPDSS
jgi:hypothetical protein